jgi:release factor glutamine methyltransferase
MPETTEEQWTIKRLLDWTDEYFVKVEAGSPRLEAEVLLAEALDCARIELYTRFDEIPDAEPMARFRDWVKRRGAGEPVAYIVGHREFYSLRFTVDSNVLIPRPETEHVVVAALEVAKSITDRPLRIMDVGTGSGCIAITLAKHLEDCKIAATDLSPGAVAVAKDNAEVHQVSDRVHFFEGDLFDALPAGSGAVHLIVSNPPYIGSAELNTVDQHVRDYEPKMALFSGEHGTDVIARLVNEAGERLLPGGHLIFEAGPIVMDKCRSLVEAASGLELVEVIKDFAGLERVVVARKLADG